MAALVCDICGGKLKGRPGGIYECEFCGIEYDTAWAKAKIQEIRGTVQVEGTVQVQGSVKVEGGVNIESLLKRGQLALEDGEWDEAEKHFDEALNIDAESAEAYLGKVCATWQAVNVHMLLREEQTYINRIEADANFQKVLRFSDEATAVALREKVAVSKRRFGEKVAALAETRRKIAPVKSLINAGYNYSSALKLDGTPAVAGSLGVGWAESKKWANIKAISYDDHFHVAGLQADGTVVAAGREEYGECDIGEWAGLDIVSVLAMSRRTVALTSSGTVVSAGERHSAKNDWINIIAIEKGRNGLVGLKADGTVEAECGEVSDWTDVVAISGGNRSIAGLKSDGTVVVTAENETEIEASNGWTNVVEIAAGGYHIVGLKSDGTVVATGNNYYGQCDVSSWVDVVSISAGDNHTVGLRSDGTVVAVGHNKDRQCNVKGWSDVVAISAGNNHTVGLKADGTVVAVGYNSSGQCNVDGWRLFNHIETLEQERVEQKELQERKRKAEQERLAAERRAKEERLYAERRAGQERLEAMRQARLAEKRKNLETSIAKNKEACADFVKEKETLQAELPTVKGLFAAKRRKEIEARLIEIAKNLENAEEEIAKLEEKLKGM